MNKSLDQVALNHSTYGQWGKLMTDICWDTKWRSWPGWGRKWERVRDRPFILYLNKYESSAFLTVRKCCGAKELPRQYSTPVWHSCSGGGSSWVNCHCRTGVATEQSQRDVGNLLSGHGTAAATAAPRQRPCQISWGKKVRFSRFFTFWSKYVVYKKPINGISD